MALEKGQQAPDFEAPNQKGETVKLSDYQGKKVVLYFYPRDMTPGCTSQACNLRDNYNDLQSKGYEVIGISTDDEASHTKFIDKYNLPFTLVADKDHSIAEAYDVWKEKNMYGKKFWGIKRTTFVIDEEGKIEDIIKKVKTKEHTAQIMEA